MGFVIEFDFSHIVAFGLGFILAYLIFKGKKAISKDKALPRIPILNAPKQTPTRTLTESGPVTTSPAATASPQKLSTTGPTPTLLDPAIKKAGSGILPGIRPPRGEPSKANSMTDVREGTVKRRLRSTSNLAGEGEDKKTPARRAEVAIGIGRLRDSSKDQKPRSSGSVDKAPQIVLKKRNSNEEMTWEDLKTSFSDPVSGVRLRDRKKKMRGKTQKNCFAGSEAIDWLVSNLEGVDRQRATDIGVRLWASGLFRHVSHRSYPFSDGDHYYCFSNKKHDKESKAARLNRRKSVLDDRFEDIRIQQCLKRKDGWLDIQEKDGFVKRWCIVQEKSAIPSEDDGDSKETDYLPKGWSLFIFKQVTDRSLLDLVKEMTHPQSGLSIKSRRYLLKNYPNCFVGKKAVDWVMANKPGYDTREKAVELLGDLMHKGLLVNAEKEQTAHHFKDCSDWYRFQVALPKSGNDSSELIALQPIGFIPLNNRILLKLKKQKDFVHLSLYSSEGHEILNKTRSPEDPKKKRNSSKMLEDRLELNDPTTFTIRLYEKDDANVKDWVFTLEAAILLGDGTFDTTPQAQGFDDDEGEYISGDDEDKAGDEDELQEPPPKEVMNSAETALLDEMKKILRREKETGTIEVPADEAYEDEDFTLVPDSELVKFLRARKLEVTPAVRLMKDGIVYRKRNNLNGTTITDVLEEVRGGMLRLIPGAKDKQGRVVVLIQPQYYKPARTPPLAIVRGVMYLLDCAMENDDEVQRVGFTVLVDAQNSKYSNFDAHMPKPLINGMIGKYPARLGFVIIANTPWFFKFCWAVLRPLLSEYLVSKFHIVGTEDLINFVDAESLLPMHNGTNPYDHEAWIKSRFEAEGIPYDNGGVSE